MHMSTSECSELTGFGKPEEAATAMLEEERQKLGTPWWCVLTGFMVT